MLSPGREHDLKILDELIKNAKTPKEINKWNNKARQIVAEGNNPRIVKGRELLIEATKRNDIKEIEKISDYLHSVGRDNGSSR